ncbi:MAG: hypothetical protein H6R40_1369, partial [Gemmatimonadetes bacterium]|nr:hypothetical protein [Gemmatimonadota bacterium]
MSAWSRDHVGHLLGLVVLLLAGTGPELRAQGADTASRLGMDPAVRTATLPNGLR